MSENKTLSRRDFLKTTAAAAGGLVIGFVMPGGARRAFAEPAGASKINAFLRIAPDSTVTVLLKHSEMGQGIATSLPMVIAEELDCDWSKVKSEHAPAGPDYYHTMFMSQMTGGSTSTNESFAQMRNAGATARAMLVEAAAKKWGVDKASCRTENGFVIAGDKKASYGDLAGDAAALQPPKKVDLKDPKDWKIIGTRVKRLDTPAKVAGRAEFGIDVKRPGMVSAVVVRPAFGAKVKSFKDDAAKAAGADQVVQIPSGIAVIAKDTWTARRAAGKLEVEWTPADGEPLSTAKLKDQYRELSKKAGAKALEKGDATAALANGKTIEAEYDVPFLSHSPMEPLNATVELGDDGCDIWAGTQGQTLDQMNAARILGIKPEKVRVHTTFLGGGFGRRVNAGSDFISEAVEIAKAVKKPVQVTWSREDDIRGGFYRPMWMSRIRAKLGDDGMPVAWAHTLVGQSIMVGTPFEPMMVKDGVDGTSVEGAANSPYLSGVPDALVDLHSPKSPVTVLWWRSVGHTHTAFVVESFIDELASAAKKDPLEYRRALLKDHPRPLRALNLAAEKFGWGKALPAGHGAGIAVHESFGSFVAEAVEVSVEKNKIRVHRVVAAIDCGPVVNPDTVEAQVQSAIVFGLTAALKTEITLMNGQVEQSNFHDYPLLRISEMPQVEVHIVPSTDPMGGVGEPGVPPIAPAVANAVFAATGKRLRSLPMRL